jgi:dienelactone hydrolase
MSQGNYDPRFNQSNPFAPQPGNFQPTGSFGGAPGQFPGGYSGYPNQGQQPPKSNAMKNVLISFGIIGGILGVCVLFCCGAVVIAVQPPKASAAAKVPFNVASVAVPALPDRGVSTELEPGVQLYTVKINGQTGGHYSPPGHGGTLYVMLPSGQHAPQSLPCVLITGAGTDLMQGYLFDGITQEGDGAEMIPYVKAGMAVIAYELDGGMSYDDENFDEEVDYEARAYDDFKASMAGLVNGRNALEYALTKVPEVNPAKIYSAGHSSAGTAALLLAAHEPRLAGCVAYAPCSDVEHFQPPFLVRMLAKEYKGLVDFLCQSSPTTHAANIKCPVFLFSAEDDDTVEIKTTRDFERLLKKHNNDVTLQTVPSGGHYDPMIEQGIPAGIAWIKQH